VVNLIGNRQSAIVNRKLVSTVFPQAAFTLCIIGEVKKFFCRKPIARQDIGQVEKKSQKTLLKPVFCFQ
jgi:hypothetical protein